MFYFSKFVQLLSISNISYSPKDIVVNTSRSFPHIWLITGFVTRLTRRVPLVDQELLTLPEHMSSPPGFSGVRVTRSLVLYVCFVDRCLSFCTFSLGHCVVCSSSTYGFWLPLWYLQTLLITNSKLKKHTDQTRKWRICSCLLCNISIIYTISNIKMLPSWSISQSVPITTEAMSSNADQARCTRYNIMW